MADLNNLNLISIILVIEKCDGPGELIKFL